MFLWDSSTIYVASSRFEKNKATHGQESIFAYDFDLFSCSLVLDFLLASRLPSSLLSFFLSYLSSLFGQEDGSLTHSALL